MFVGQGLKRLFLPAEPEDVERITGFDEGLLRGYNNQLKIPGN